MKILTETKPSIETARAKRPKYAARFCNCICTRTAWPESHATGLDVDPFRTSSNGASVLPFKSALFEPALQLGCPITAAAIGYSLPKGSVADEVCYWRGMTLLSHLLNLFTKAKSQSKLSVATFELPGGDRNRIARELRREIASMRS